MGEDDVRLFKPRHFGGKDLAAVPLHILQIALRPLALPLFEGEVGRRKFFRALDIGRIEDGKAGVADLDGERDIFRHHMRKSARPLVAAAGDHHAVAEQGVGAVKVFDHLHGAAVARHASAQKPLEHVLPFRSHMARLHGAAIFIRRKIAQRLGDEVGRDHLVAVEHHKIVVIAAAAQVVVEVARLVAAAVLPPHDFYIGMVQGVLCRRALVGGVGAVVQDDRLEIAVILAAAAAERLFVEVVAGAVQKEHAGQGARPRRSAIPFRRPRQGAFPFRRLPL